ncbi:hypothetical protein SAMN05421853_101430 [Roseivivax halotolerans]|uniref:Inner membrane protein n=1 Tax=Roseivivax halotolerans TaxID=93684 RepID=A0A1I5VBX9_9RHOB|nr:hypothetical protein [Roseivivax halotolerans]SFQ04912.1 hypothetical protein SAMN05421853_101430 [Roseivivax halotolerans]
MAKSRKPKGQPEKDDEATGSASDQPQTVSPADDSLQATDQTDTIAATDDSDTIRATEPDKLDDTVEDSVSGTLNDSEPSPTADDEIAEAPALTVSDPEPTLDGSDTGDDSQAADRTDSNDDGSAIADGAPDLTEPPVAGAAAPVVHEKVIERKAGFVPTFLGGILAAIAGFLLSQYVGGDLFGSNDEFANETRSALEEQSSNLQSQQAGLDALGGRIDGIETGLADIDLSSIETAIADLTTRTADLGKTVSELADRVSAVEAAPVQSAAPEAVSAFEAELARMRQEVEELAQQAVEAERAAAAQASRADVNAALSNLTAEVDAGRPFAEALVPLLDSELVEVPEALTSQAEDGVASLGALQDSFPDAARDALAAARASGSGESSGNRLSGFLAEQLGARSVTPRDGSSADAILSRAEAELQSGALDAALSELSSLPEPAADAMSGWVTRANARIEALAATEDLAAQLNSQ